MVFIRLIPSRFKIGILGMTACSLMYTLRVNFNVAIVAMVPHTQADNRHPNDWCSDQLNSSQSDESQQTVASSGAFEWSESIQGIILGAYFYGFTATQITGGLLAERWGAKWVCGLGIFIPALVNALSPLAAYQNYSCLIVTRVIIGAFHGLIHSSLFSMYAKWFPTQERTIAIAATQFGGNIGGAFMAPLAGYLCDHGFGGGWPSVFYISSLIHVIWLMFWWYSAHDSPGDDTSISPDEHLYILQNTDSQITKMKASPPWASILKSPAVYGSLLAKTSGTFGYYVLMTSINLYFNSIFNLRFTESGIYVALMFVAVGVAMMSAGPLSTLIIAKTSLNRTRVRKIFQMIAMVGPAVCLLIVPSLGCNLVPVIILFVLSMCLYGFITGGEYAIVPEFAPEFTGTVFGLTNTLASSMGFLGPIIVGQILDSKYDEDRGTRKKWNLVFYITAAFYLLGAVFFELFASAERQPWAYVSKRESDIELDDIHAISNRSFKNPKPVDTQTPEWIEFKKNTFVF